MNEIVGIAAIIGLINGIKLYENVDKKPFMYFCFSIVLGILAGGFNLFGIKGIETGILYGLSASGLYKVTKNIGSLS